MANFITGIRIVCGIFLLFCPAFSVKFYSFYVLGGVSDALDGFVARHFGKETEFGSKLDTAADIIFFTASVFKIMTAVSFPLWLMLWILGIALIKAVNIASGYILQKRFVSEHTVMNKICGIMLFAVPFLIKNYPSTKTEMFMIAVCAVSTSAAVQEGHFIRAGKKIR